MIAFLVVALLLAADVAAQTCSTTATQPAVNNMCPTGFTLIASRGCCCPNGNVIGANPSTCVDKVNPNTGVSECAANFNLCGNSAYANFMKDQCPKTCGYCTSSCVDLVNSSTGVSDCPRLVAYCNNSLYAATMAVQCRKTCRLC